MAGDREPPLPVASGLPEAGGGAVPEAHPEASGLPVRTFAPLPAPSATADPLDVRAFYQEPGYAHRGPAATAPWGDGSIPTVEPEASTEEAGALTLEEMPGRYVPDQGSTPTVVGQGGLGRVLVYRDRMLGRLIARKELLPSAVSQRAAFLKEARVTAQLEHPNIVPVYEQGLTATGQPYYTMKWVRGQSLEEVLASAEGMADRLYYLGHFVDICQAVAYAHSRGVIHRDLKP